MNRIARLDWAKSVVEHYWGEILIFGLASFLAGMAFNWVGIDFLQVKNALWGDRYDTLLNSYTVYQAFDNLLHRPTDLGHSLIFYNNPDSFGYTIAPYGIAIFMLPLYVLSGQNLILTYNVYLFLTIPMTALAGYWLARQVVKARPLPAMVAGLMIAFCQYRFAHLPQVENQSFQFYIFALYSFHKLLEKSSWRWVVATAVAFGLTFLTSGYLAVMFVVTVIVIMVYLVLQRVEVFNRRLVMRLVGTVALFLILVAPFLVFRFGNHEFTDGAEYEVLVTFSSSIEGWFAGTSAIYHNVEVTTDLNEHAIFVGFTPLVLAALAWRYRKSADEVEQAKPLLSVREMLTIYGITIAVGYLLSLGPLVHFRDTALFPTPYLFIYQLPFFSSIRAPARYIILVITATAVLSAYFLTLMEKRLRRPTYGFVLAAVALGMVLEFTPYNGGNQNSIRKAAAIPEDSRIFSTVPFASDLPVYQWLEDQPSDVAVLEYPYGFPWYYTYVQMTRYHHHPIFNGVGSFYPEGWWQLPWYEFPSAGMINMLVDHDIQYILVHHEYMTQNDLDVFYQRFLSLAACDPQALIYVQQFDTVGVYAIHKTACAQ